MTTPEGLRRLLEDGGVNGEVTITPEAAIHPLTCPDDWWTLVVGSGYRATVDALTPDELAHVRRRCDEALSGVSGITADVLYAIARKS